MQCKLPVLISCIKLIHNRLKIYCQDGTNSTRAARSDCSANVRWLSLRLRWTGYRRHSASRLAASASFTTIYNYASWNFEHATSLVEVGCTPHTQMTGSWCTVSIAHIYDFTHASLARTGIQCVQFEFVVSQIIYMALVDKRTCNPVIVMHARCLF